MTGQRDLVAETAREIITGAGEDPWPALEEAGLTLVGIPEEAGGSGGTLVEAAAVLSVAAYHAAPVPLAETCFLAAWLLAEAGRPVPPGRLTVATGARVAWASVADHLVAVTAEGPVVLPRSRVEIVPGRNLAGEPRDTVTLDLDLVSDPALFARGALARAIQICGAARRALDESLRYAGEREQFGRPIARFQAVQHMLAELAGEVAVAEVSVRAATADPTPVAVAAAKANASRAAGIVARLAHQIHGAIGVTEEHPLHHATLRLWSWREEYGTETHWEGFLGSLAADPWQTITG